MFKARYFTAALLGAFALAACSGAPQQGGLPATPAVAQAPVHFTSPAEALGLTPNSRGHKRPHGVPSNCSVQEVNSLSEAISFTYHKNEPAGSYIITWGSGEKIATVSPYFTFYNEPNAQGGVIDAFAGPDQNPTITKGLDWIEQDIQPDYMPTGSKSMKFEIDGTLLPPSVKAWVVANFICS